MHMKGYRCSPILLFLLLLSGCASTGSSDNSDASTREWLLSGEVLSDVAVDLPILPQDDAVSLDERMKRFVEHATAGQGSARGKVRSLIAAVIDPTGLGLTYDPGASYSARETFAHRRANCLSFTLMMVSMLRHAGVEAQFNDVDIPLIGGIRDETTLVFYKHINAIVEFPFEGRAVIDLVMDEYDTSYEQRTITDRAAAAQYYNNRSMEFLQEGKVEASFPYLVKAISLDPRQSYLWSNLGSLYQRAGKLEAAKAAFEIALAENGSDLVATSNAARLYTALGESKRAEALTRRVTMFRERNPYYRYVRAVSAYRSSDFEAAKREVTEAIHLYRQEHRFHFLLGAIYERLGLHDAAVESMNTAINLTTDAKQSARYRSKMDRLFSSAHL